MKALYALYDDGRSAQRAVDGLRDAGIADRNITVISARPMEDFEFVGIHSRSAMWYVACLGAILGFAAATGLTYITQTLWMLPTGGMPIVSWWTNLIIMFEWTMLGAILAAVGALIVGGGLLRRQAALYDPAVSDGKILVGVENPRDTSMAELKRALLVAPGVELKTM
jgi:hypothetical protein